MSLILIVVCLSRQCSCMMFRLFLHTRHLCSYWNLPHIAHVEACVFMNSLISVICMCYILMIFPCILLAFCHYYVISLDILMTYFELFPHTSQNTVAYASIRLALVNNVYFRRIISYIVYIHIVVLNFYTHINEHPRLIIFVFS